uniref:ATP synthase subunit a n=1 Tax=Bathynomus sp. YS-2016 TaxID=1863031 RepID=A0A1L2F0U7_9CRUS|nr:ATP synthase F0 subunit 6 [Bathynomus sp. YS-2016]
MMTNLFSIFDPSTHLGLPLNWVAIFLGLVIIPLGFWTLPSRQGLMFSQMVEGLMGEMVALLGVRGKGSTLMLMALFLLILVNNSMGLLPYIFTSSAHLWFTLGLALPLWFGYFLYGWAANTLHSLAHLVPQGTPYSLMPFMVLIESISGLIRPVTLSVRLAANMIAGHLLLALMSGAVSVLSPISGALIILAQIALLLLEAAVAAIQAYVFTTLSALYVSEV